MDVFRNENAVALLFRIPNNRENAVNIESLVERVRVAAGLVNQLALSPSIRELR